MAMPLTSKPKSSLAENTRGIKILCFGCEQAPQYHAYEKCLPSEFYELFTKKYQELFKLAVVFSKTLDLFVPQLVFFNITRVYCTRIALN